MLDSNLEKAVPERLAILGHLIENRKRYERAFAQTSLIGGILSIVACAAIVADDALLRISGRPIGSREFVFVWILVCVVSAIVAAFLFHRATPSNGRDMKSAARKFVVVLISPCLLVPFAFTSWFLATGYLGGAELELVVVWIAFYGLTLLSTSAFAPRSITLLGWAFLLSALAIPLLEETFEIWLGNIPVLLIGTTFGVYHVLYAAIVWPRLRGASVEVN